MRERASECGEVLVIDTVGVCKSECVEVLVLVVDTVSPNSTVSRTGPGPKKK